MPELLVVFAIIALLLALLMPTLSRAQQSARTVKCQSNQRQIGIAIVYYAQTYKGAVVPSQVDCTEGAGTTPAMSTWTPWFALLPAAGFLTIGADSYWFPSGLKDTGPLYCPEADIKAWSWNNSTPLTPTSHVSHPGWGSMAGDYSGLTGGPGAMDTSSTRRYYVSWYGVNGAHYYPNVSADGVGVLKNWACRSLPWMIDNTRYSYDPGILDQVNEPSEHAFIFDGLMIKNGQNLEGAMWNPNAIQSRHGNLTMVNVLFYDGHATALPCAVNGNLPGDISTFPGSTPITGKPFQKSNLKLYENTYPRWRNDFP